MDRKSWQKKELTWKRPFSLVWCLYGPVWLTLRWTNLLRALSWLSTAKSFSVAMMLFNGFCWRSIFDQRHQPNEYEGTAQIQIEAVVPDGELEFGRAEKRILRHHLRSRNEVWIESSSDGRSERRVHMTAASWESCIGSRTMTDCCGLCCYWSTPELS